MLEWLCTAHHVSRIDELILFLGGVSWAAFVAGFVWTLYLALEPYVRRRWPQSMITWSRVLSGGFRDPLVGGHLLAGVALGIGLSLCFLLGTLALEHYGSFHLPHSHTLNSVLDARRMTGEMLSALIDFDWNGCSFWSFLFFLLRVLLRRQWLAAAVFILAVCRVLGASLQSASPVDRSPLPCRNSWLSSLPICSGSECLPTLVTGFVGICCVNFAADHRPLRLVRGQHCVRRRDRARPDRLRFPHRRGRAAAVQGRLPRIGLTRDTK